MSDLIVSTPDTLHGRWRIQGTRMPASLVKSWAERDGIESFRKNYPRPYTDEEIAACLSWTFPPTQDSPDLSMEMGCVGCVCGESCDGEQVDDATMRYQCPACGRRYLLSVTLEAVIAATD